MQVRVTLKWLTRNHTPQKSVAINPGTTPTMVVAKSIMVITTMEGIKEIMVGSRETITMAIIMEMVIPVLILKERRTCLM